MTSSPYPPPCWDGSNLSSNPISGLNRNMSSASGDSQEKIVITLAICRLCLAVLGCVANVIAAVVLTNRKLWSPTSMLLLSLVIYDAFYLLVVIPMSVGSISVNLHFTAARYSALRTITSLCFPLRFVAHMASTYTTLTLTLERYLVILLPLKASAMWTYGKTRKAIIGVLFFSLLFNLPRFFDHIILRPTRSTAPAPGIPGDPGSDGNLTSSWNYSVPDSEFMRHALQNSSESDVMTARDSRCTNVGSGAREVASGFNWDRAGVSLAGNLTQSQETAGGVSENYFYRVVYLFYLTVIFLYLIPYTLIPVLNLQLVMALRRRREETRRISVKKEHRLNGACSNSSPTDKEEGLTYIVFGITLSYFICCILPTAYMIYAVASGSSNDRTAIFIFNAGETTLVINAATDFFFYCLLGRKFRRVFMRTFCPKRYIKKTKAMTLRSTVSYNSV